jgi:hypothetical protein
MEITNPLGQVNLWPDELRERKVGISLSGGADSALLLFFYHKFFTDNDIDYVLLTGCDSARPWTKDSALFLADHFPGHSGHFFYEYDSNKISDPEAQAKGTVNLVLDNKIDAIISGTTHTPPDDETYNNWPFLQNRRGKTGSNILVEHEVWIESNGEPCTLTRRHFGTKTDKTLLQYRPLALVNKKWVAEEYRKNNLMESVFPKTISCVGYADDTKNFTEPCKECWWCKEKHWAFGFFDSAISG